MLRIEVCRGGAGAKEERLFEGASSRAPQEAVFPLSLFSEADLLRPQGNPLHPTRERLPTYVHVQLPLGDGQRHGDAPVEVRDEARQEGPVDAVKLERLGLVNALAR